MKKESAKPASKTPEAAISSLSKSGALRKIGRDAIRESHAMGLAVTIMEDGVIYRVHPDGTRTVRKVG